MSDLDKARAEIHLRILENFGRITADELTCAIESLIRAVIAEQKPRSDIGPYQREMAAKLHAIAALRSGFDGQVSIGDSASSKDHGFPLND